MTEPTDTPEWVRQYVDHAQTYDQQHWRPGFIESVATRFGDAISTGDISLPLDIFPRCAFGHHLIYGQLVQSETSAKIFFVPDESFICQPTNGVIVWQNGDPTALDKAGVFWATLRIRLTCPQKGCTYSPQLQSSALAARLMLAALDGDLTPVLDV